MTHLIDLVANVHGGAEGGGIGLLKDLLVGIIEPVVHALQLHGQLYQCSYVVSGRPA